MVNHLRVCKYTLIYHLWESDRFQGRIYQPDPKAMLPEGAAQRVIAEQQPKRIDRESIKMPEALDTNKYRKFFKHN